MLRSLKPFLSIQTFIFSLQICFFLDVLNKANLLLVNLKEIIEDLEAKNLIFQNQLEKVTMENKKLTIENKQLNISNKHLCSEVNFLRKEMRGKSIG